jgi:hypothetical protein
LTGRSYWWREGRRSFFATKQPLGVADIFIIFLFCGLGVEGKLPYSGVTALTPRKAAAAARRSVRWMGCGVPHGTERLLVQRICAGIYLCLYWWTMLFMLCGTSCWKNLHLGKRC